MSSRVVFLLVIGSSWLAGCLLHTVLKAFSTASISVVVSRQSKTSQRNNIWIWISYCQSKTGQALNLSIILLISVVLVHCILHDHAGSRSWWRFLLVKFQGNCSTVCHKAVFYNMWSVCGIHKFSCKLLSWNQHYTLCLGSWQLMSEGRVRRGHWTTLV